MYTLKDIESGQGFLVSDWATIWQRGNEDVFVTADRGAGHLKEVTNLRKAAANNSGILGQRAEHAYSAAAGELCGEETWEACKRAVCDILTRAGG